MPVDNMILFIWGSLLVAAFTFYICFYKLSLKYLINELCYMGKSSSIYVCLCTLLSMTCLKSSKPFYKKPSLGDLFCYCGSDLEYDFEYLIIPQQS